MKTKYAYLTNACKHHSNVTFNKKELLVTGIIITIIIINYTEVYEILSKYINILLIGILYK